MQLTTTPRLKVPNLSLPPARCFCSISANFGILSSQLYCSNTNGATIVAALNAKNVERSIVSDQQGRFRFIKLEPGTYSVRVTATGFVFQERPNVDLVAGQNAQLDFSLRVEGISEELVVAEEEAPVVDTTRTIVGGTITRDELEVLPNPTRSPLEFVFTLPGVTEEPFSVRDLAEDRNSNASSAPEEAGIFALAGGAAYSNNITIDGLDNNDDRAARERFQPSLEAVEEVQVITNQFAAEYGRASGGRVNLRTRGGSNNFRARLFYFFKDESLNANTWRNNLLGKKRLPLQQHTPGFTFSGPLGRVPFTSSPSSTRTKTHFFISYENDQTLDSALIDTLCQFGHKVKIVGHKVKRIRA